jgi:hypothetical protein
VRDDRVFAGRQQACHIRHDRRVAFVAGPYEPAAHDNTTDDDGATHDDGTARRAGRRAGG